MKWSMSISGDVMQMNLTPETEYEMRAFDLLQEYSGVARIHKGVSLETCIGGYLRNYGEDHKSMAITITKEGA